RERDEFYYEVYVCCRERWLLQYELTLKELDNQYYELERLENKYHIELRKEKYKLADDSYKLAKVEVHRAFETLTSQVKLLVHLENEKMIKEEMEVEHIEEAATEAYIEEVKQITEDPVKEVKTVEHIEGALDDGNCSRIRILMRFLTVLMCCKVVQPTALLVVFETLLSSAATLVDEEKGISSWQACADFYITCILSCLPWGGSELIEDLQPIDRFVVEEYLLDVLLFLNGCRKECASYMVGLPVPFRYEYLMAETIFTQEIEEIQTGKGLNQIGTLQRPGDTRWSSHFTAICSLIRMYGATHSVLIDVAAQGTTFSQRDMNAPYFDVLKSLRRQGKQKQMVTMEHHYRVEIFTAAIDQQLQELNNRFSEQMTELLILSASLNPRDGCRSFNIENICKLAEKFYPEVFLGDEKIHLQCELQHYGLDVPVHPDLKNLSTLGDLCHGLVTTGKADMYPLVDRLLRLVLTLPASTATSERAFSAMKIVKTSLRNRMEDEFLRDYLIVYIEKEIAETISAEEIIDSFYLIKERRAHLK
ncbi:hypothetical protein AgCh_013771, partial [Apium graveolens]